MRPPMTSSMDTLDRLRGRYRPRTAVPGVPGRAGEFRLSAEQDRIWHLQHGPHQQGIRNVVARLRLTGVVDRAVLGTALDALLVRHDALRTGFTVRNGPPMQHTLRTAPGSVRTVDLSAETVGDAEAHCDALVAMAAGKEFDLGSPPLLDATIVHMPRREHVLVLVAHRLIADEPSLLLLGEDLVTTYLRLERDSRAVFTEPKAPSFRAWLDGPSGPQRGIEPERLHLPGHAIHADGPPTARTAPLSLPAPTLEGLDTVATEVGTTVHVLLLTAVVALLGRYSDEDRVTVWLARRDAPAEGGDGIVGPLEQRQPITVELSSGGSFRAWSQQVAAQLEAAETQPSTPVAPPRPQVGFTVRHRSALLSNAAQRLVVTEVEVVPVGPECDLEVVVEEGDGVPRAVVRYASDVFGAADAARLAGHLEQLLDGAITEPDQPPSTVSLLSSSETQQLAEWDARHDEPPTRALHELFEAHAAETPEAIAITFGEGHVTYDELNREANRVAHRLVADGVQAQQPVAVLLENGPQQVTAMLGVLKTGAAFVCLDPVHPTRRLLEILEETETEFLIADARALARHPDLAAWVERAAAHVVMMDADAEEPAENAIFAELAAENPGLDVDPSGVAYIVYTSGSTGRPKGIVQSHRSFVQFVTWQSDQFHIGASERWAQWASIAYDASYCEIFGTLCFGATLCMASEAVRYDPTALADWVRREGITILQIVPSFCRELVEVLRQHAEGDGHPLPSVRLLLLAGEVLPVDLARDLLRFPDAPALYNLYGPSETVLASYHHVDRVSPGDQSVPVGRPIRGRQILILDKAGLPCPIGVQGELFIRSPYLTLGYFKREQETASRFLDHSLPDGDADPVFRTGDLGRWTPDGTIEFLGRRDNLVKLRGIRVELGDVEASVRRHPAVANCAALVRTARSGRGTLVAKERDVRASGGAEGKKVLVAYYTTRESLAPSALRQFLESELPAHMIPQQLIQLDALPLNANRKLDVQALPEPDVVRPELAEPYTAPRTPREERVAAIWAEVLGLERVGVHDGFFELGGDSLLAMQVLNRLRQVFDASVSFRDLFEHGTVAQLAERLGEEVQEGVLQQLGGAERDGRTAYPLSLAQQGVWFLWRLEPESPYYTAQGTIHIRGDLDLAALREAWRGVVERHDVLRARFATEGDRPVQIFDDRRCAELSVVDLTHLPEAERLSHLQARAAVKGRRALDLELDALLQPELFKLAEDHHELLITFQEIILDLWGISVIVKDLGELYRRIRQGESEPLPALPVGFGDYVLWEQERLQRDKLRAQELYWQEQLAGELPILALPVDRPRSNTPTYRGAAQTAMLEAELTGRLRALSTDANATLFMTLLAASYVLLQRYSGQDDVIIGSPIANRTAAHSEAIVGFFLNMLPLRALLDDDPTFLELMERVRARVTGAISNAEYPFMWMAEGTRTARDTSVSPVFQVMFNMLNLPHTACEVEGLTLSFSELDTGYTKYDMSFYAQEQGERLFVQIAYLSDLFDEATVARMVANYEALLRSVVENPNRPISTLPVVSEAERQALLEEMNDTHRDFDLSAGIAELFEAQVRRTPDEPALLWEGQSISYVELNERANQLAHYLRAREVSTGTRVALCLPRSFDMMVAILGVLKAGGTYVALEPTYPTPRLEAILDDAEPDVLIVHSTLNRFTDFADTTIVLDVEQSAIGQERLEDPTPVTTPDSVLNVVYTSASTGTPKGALITMRAVLNRLRWMWEEFPFRDGDVALLQKSYALVAATWECFGGLLVGIPTVILSQDEIIDPAAIWRRLVTHGVSHVLASPAFFEGILDQAEQHPEEWQTLRFASTSAEPIPVSMVARWRRCFDDVPLLNLYGSTECSSNVTVYDTRQLSLSAERVPIGKPLANTRVYVLDERLRPVPQGATGEMCVAGACLANGYLNLPALTAERFIENPFAEGSYDRLFRTGDLARVRNDGQLELIGRRDHQVKIRGFRVELADVEQALHRHPEVRRCAVALWESEGRSRLVAYVVGADGLRQPTLWRFLRERLPDYMVPAQYVFLERLPLTPNGKVDRAALPVPEQGTSAATGRAPQSSAERFVHGIWQQVLAVETLGIDDNFFELGGHSLLATQVVSRLRDWFQIEVPVRGLFEHPTVAGLVGVLADLVGGREVVDEIADTLLVVEGLSDDEVRAQLSE